MSAKPEWGSGEWDNEPDRAEWKDEATGMPCLAVRHPRMGHWCGYVGLPPGHKWHGKDYEELNVDVHGGLTYARECQGEVCHVAAPGEPENIWWLGFDCVHASDLSPGLEHQCRDYPSRKLIDDLPEEYRDKYRNLDYVRQECASLARQLSAAYRDDFCPGDHLIRVKDCVAGNHCGCVWRDNLSADPS